MLHAAQQTSVRVRWGPLLEMSGAAANMTAVCLVTAPGSPASTEVMAITSIFKTHDGAAACSQYPETREKLQLMSGHRNKESLSAIPTCMRNARSARERIWDSMEAPE